MIELWIAAALFVALNIVLFRRGFLAGMVAFVCAVVAVVFGLLAWPALTTPAAEFRIPDAAFTFKGLVVVTELGWISFSVMAFWAAARNRQWRRRTP